MGFIYFAKPIYMPMIFPPMVESPPLVFYPVNNITFRFPVPVLYSTPPVPVL